MVPQKPWVSRRQKHQRAMELNHIMSTFQPRVVTGLIHCLCPKCHNVNVRLGLRGFPQSGSSVSSVNHQWEGDEWDGPLNPISQTHTHTTHQATQELDSDRNCKVELSMWEKWSQTFYFTERIEREVRQKKRDKLSRIWEGECLRNQEKSVSWRRVKISNAAKIK